MVNYNDYDNFSVTSHRSGSCSLKQTNTQKHINTKSKNGKYTSKHVRITQMKHESSKHNKFKKTNLKK